jgi:gentisate 1,2-dioxygenase
LYSDTVATDGEGRAKAGREATASTEEANPALTNSLRLVIDAFGRHARLDHHTPRRRTESTPRAECGSGAATLFVVTRAHDSVRDNEAAFQRRAASAGLVPLWTFFKEWFSAEPQPGARPHLWRYAELRALVMEAAAVVSTADAERRVLVLENPGLKGRHLATDSLYAGLQLIMPGERARAHRHTAAALRFIIEGANTYTAVAGERCYMRPGDFIVTPSWAWHDHCNESGEPAIWLDVLDVALLRLLGSGFSEHHPDGEHPQRVPPGDSRLRYGRHLVPVGFERSAGASPVFAYPFDYAYEALEHLRAHSDWDACHGIKMEYIDPTTGGPAIPTISTFLQLVPAEFATSPYRATASCIVSVVRGRGRVTIGQGTSAATFEYEPKDLWVVPSWQHVSVSPVEESVLFCASDEAVHRKLGVWREQRGG